MGERVSQKFTDRKEVRMRKVIHVCKYCGHGYDEDKRAAKRCERLGNPYFEFAVGENLTLDHDTQWRHVSQITVISTAIRRCGSKLGGRHMPFYLVQFPQGGRRWVSEKRLRR